MQRFHGRIPFFLILLLPLLAVLPAAAQPRLEELNRQAVEAYQNKDFARSAELFEELAAYGDPRLAAAYNAACAYALAGRKDKALELLGRIVEQGYHQADQLQADTDLEALRGDPRWPVLVARAEANLRLKERLWGTSPLSTPYREELGEDERIAGLSRLWSEVRYNFVNFDLVPDVDWDALYLEALPRVRQAKSTRDYYLVLRELIARLRDGHTNVYEPAALTDEVYAQPLVATRWIEGRVLIAEVLDPKLERAGVTAGLEVVAIDGIPVRRYGEERVRPYASASTPQDLEIRTFEYGLLAGPVSRPVELTLRDAGGKESAHRLPRVSRDERRQRLVSRRPGFELRWLPGRVAHVILNGFDNDQPAQEFAQAFPEIAEAGGLILDVRNNGGGNSGVGHRILGFLTDRRHLVSRWRSRTYTAAYRAWDQMNDAFEEGEVSLAPARGVTPYAGPVVVLTSPRTYSAAEDFAVAFDVMDRGLIIGEPTGGSTGQPLFVPLPGGGSARICTKRDTYPDGRDFVGAGIQPDRLVRPTVEDFRAGRDTVLEAALAEIRRRSEVTIEPKD